MVTFTAASVCPGLKHSRLSQHGWELKPFLAIRVTKAMVPKVLFTLFLAATGSGVGWGHINPAVAQSFQTAPAIAQLGLLGVGNEGEAVAQLQRRLAELGFFQGEATGIYGSLTEEAVIRYQDSVGLLADGISGPETLEMLFGQTAPSGQQGSGLMLSSSQLSNLQSQLSSLGFYLGTVDGINGPQTEAAINSFQSVYSLPVTGIVDERTLATINRIYAQTPGSSPSVTIGNSNNSSGIMPGSIRRDVSTRSVTLPPAIPSGPTLATTIPQTTITSVPLPAPINPPIRSQEFGILPTQSPSFDLPPLSNSSGERFAINPQPSVDAASEVTGYPYVVAVPIKTGATLDEVRQVMVSAFLTGSKRGMYIQAGAYNSREDAEQVTQALRARRLDARVVYRPK